MDLILSIDWLSDDNLLSWLLEVFLSALAPLGFSPLAAAPVWLLDTGELFENLLGLLELVDEEEVGGKESESEDLSDDAASLLVVLAMSMMLLSILLFLSVMSSTFVMSTMVSSFKLFHNIFLLLVEVWSNFLVDFSTYWNTSNDVHLIFLLFTLHLVVFSVVFSLMFSMVFSMSSVVFSVMISLVFTPDSLFKFRWKWITVKDSWWESSCICD